MMLRQTFAEFLDNPMGKGSHAILSRQLILKDLQDRYKVMRANKKKFKHTVWINKNTYFIHVTVPSEAPARDNTYDIVLRFTLPEGRADVAKQPTLRDYEIAFFSNSPSFVYTYAHAFELYEAFVSELSSKYDPMVLRSAPATRNPAITMNYEKTIIYAMLYLEELDLLDKKLLQREQKQYNKNVFAASIRHVAKTTMQAKLAKQNEQKKEDTYATKKPLPRGTVDRSLKSSVSKVTARAKKTASTSKTKRSTRITTRTATQKRDPR